MMRVLTLASILLLCALTVPVSAEPWAFGVKGGVAYTSIRFEDAASTKPEWQPVAGLFLILPPRWGIALQPEVLYARLGARLTETLDKTTIAIDMLEVPILGRVPLGHRLHLVAGPSVAVRLRARTRTAIGGATEEFDISPQVRRLGVGLAGGAEVQAGALTIGGRYTYGLTDIDKDTTDEATTRTRALSVTAAWRF